jgi:hypothetical protein
MRTDTWVSISNKTGATLACLSIDGVGDVIPEELLSVFISTRVTRSHKACVNNTSSDVVLNKNIIACRTLEGTD